MRRTIAATIAAPTLAILLAPLVAQPAHAQYGESALYNFCSAGGSACSDGSATHAGLVSDSQGNLYGVTPSGGIHDGGTVFELSPPAGSGSPWSETVLYSFCSQSNCVDGKAPDWATPILDSQGNLYGVTASGGAYNAGAVFELNSPAGGSGSWTESVLYSFTCAPNSQSCSDGEAPLGRLVFDSQGNLYGTTVGGGPGGSSGGGVVFELSPPVGGSGAWTEKLLYEFSTSGDGGWYPRSGLLLDAKGNLYGTTYEGGAEGNGTAYELSPATSGSGPWTKTILYSFCRNLGACVDGASPHGELIFDAQGNLYGTTVYAGANAGGDYDDYGVVFELSPPASGSGPWTQKVLYSFCARSNCSDGQAPFSALVFDSSGNLYGTTESGGAYGGGAVFEVTPHGGGSWTETVLHSFCSQGCSDGTEPYAALIRDVQGNLYSTTVSGGAHGQGTVFEVLPGGSSSLIALTSSPEPSNYGETVTLAATVSSSSGMPTGL
ncbi:MAG: choice-of-anchor tandem repeat GloVer-containing protein, partial [Terriglobales bacterium]